jgi:hypothetical protein
MASENKDKMAVDRRKIMAILVELRDEARRIGNRDARETAEDHIKQARLAKTEDDWLDLQTATHYIDEMMHSKPGKKDTMAATITRIPKTKHFAGKWIEGTWDNGYTWSALVFTEPSDYGIPEFRHISKLYLNPPGQRGFGDTVLHYERGWDPGSKPTTPLLKRALNDIGRVATAYAQKWAQESDDHSKPGEKDTMAVEDRFYFGKGRKAKFSMFGIGDKVRATSSVQGMKSGTVYKVTDIDKRHTPFGTFVTYTLDGKLSIANGHLVLEKASNSRSGGKAKFAWQREITDEIRRHDMGIQTAEENLRSASKEGKWAVAQSFCNQAKNHYAALADLYSQLARLVTNPRKGI